jgi:MraZ protein
MFFGSHSTRVDDKGRVKLSSDFKAVVDRECGGPEFFITSVDGKRAQLFPLKEWIKKQEFLQTIPQSNPIRQRYQDVTSRYGAVAEMDAQGRLLIPQVLREEAKMTAEVTIVAKNPILEVVITSEFHEDARPLSKEERLLAAEMGL